VGPSERLAVGFGRTFYMASQLDIAAISGGLRSGVAALGGSATTTTPSGGTVIQDVMLLGAHRRFGQLTIAVEAGPGVRFATYTAGLLVELQPKLDLWLTPNISLGAVGGFDLVHHDGFSAALVMGFHLTPYDMAR
jgi:hypothetical protein